LPVDLHVRQRELDGRGSRRDVERCSMPNRLAKETSPYLRQHAENPVDWYPWGEDAFRRAREEDRSTYRWDTPRATGATSWRTSRSRTQTSRA
jgi:hypothetical protein